MAKTPLKKPRGHLSPLKVEPVGILRNRKYQMAKQSSTKLSDFDADTLENIDLDHPQGVLPRVLEPTV